LPGKRGTRRKAASAENGSAAGGLPPSGQARRGEGALSCLLAAGGGGSFLGCWRLWGVPPSATSADSPDLPGVAFFLLLGAVPALLAGLAWWHLGVGGEVSPAARLLALRRVAAPLMLAWLPVGGLAPHGRTWTVYWLILLAGASGFLGALSVAGRAPGEKTRLSRGRACAVVAIVAAVVGLLYAWTAILGFRGLYNCSYTDFGGFHNAAWNTLHGRFMWSDHWSGSIWRDHLSGFLLIPALFLLIWEKAETFLILQAMALVAAAVPVFLLAHRETKRAAFAVTLAFAFLLSPFVGRVAMYEFHDLSFAVLTMAWLLWACGGHGPPWLFLLFGALALVVREDMALPVLAVGLWEATFGRRTGRGIALALMAVAWGVLCVNVFMPSAQAGHWLWQTGAGGHLDRYGHLGESYGAILLNILRHPLRIAGPFFASERLANYVLLLLPLALLPLASPQRLWLAAPTFLLHALAYWPYQNQLDCQYSAPLIPVLFFSASDGAGRIVRIFERTLQRRGGRTRKGRQTKATGAWTALTACLLATAVSAHLFTARWKPGLPPPLSPYDGRRHLSVLAFPWRPALWARDDHARLFQALRDVLPPRAGLCAPDVCAPHLTSRPIVRAFRRLSAKADDDLDFVLFSPHIPTHMQGDDALKQLAALIADPRWNAPWVHQDIVLFTRKDKVPEKTRKGLEALRREFPDGPQAHQLIAYLARQAGRNELARREEHALLDLAADGPQSEPPPTKIP